MKSKVSDSILSIQQWKAQAGISCGTIREGWDVAADDLVAIDRPLTFYFCEPLKSRFAALAIFNRDGFENLVASGIEKYGTSEEIFAAVTAVTDELIENPTAVSPELLDAVVTGNLMISSVGPRASEVVQEKTFRKFGMIVYKNPARKDDLISFAPMKISEEIAFSEAYTSAFSEWALEKDRAVLTVFWSMGRGADLLPRHFEGVSFSEAACEFAEKVGVDLPMLWED